MAKTQALHRHSLYTSSITEQSKYIKQISTFPERDPYTLVYDNKLTLAGQSGSSTDQLITKIGAVNQLKEDVLNLIEPNWDLRKQSQGA